MSPRLPDDRRDWLFCGGGCGTWGELVEEEAVAGDEDGLVFGGFTGGVGEAGGVLDGEALFVEGVGGEVAALGEAFFLVFGGFVLGIAAVEEIDGGGEGGGVIVDPAMVVEGIGVGLASGEDFFGAVDLAGKIRGFVDADLELAVEAGVVFRESEGGTAAGTGEEALKLGEGFDLLLGHLADFAEGPALGDAAGLDELDLGLEERGEDDVRLAGSGALLGKTASDGRADSGINKGGMEALRVAEKGTDGEVE
jgi:hypothetical protein